jgi:hypothetical protein
MFGTFLEWLSIMKLRNTIAVSEILTVGTAVLGIRSWFIKVISI